MGPVTLPSFLQCRDRTSKGSSVVPTVVTWFEAHYRLDVFVSPGSFIFMWKSCMWVFFFPKLVTVHVLID